MKANFNSKQLGFMAAMLANILWGTSFLASKYTLLRWSPFASSALRFLIASFVMFILALVLKRPIQKLDKNSFIGILLISLTSFVALYPLQLGGLKTISSSYSSVLMLTSPLFVICLAPLVLGERITLNKVLAIVLGIIGGVVLMIPSINEATHAVDFTGSVLTLLASFSLGASVVVTRKASPKMDTLSLTFWSMFFGALGLLATALFVEKDYSTFINFSNSQSLVALLYLSIVCSVLCFFLWNFALKLSPARDLATTMHIKTPTAIAVGVILAQESISISMIIGFVLVMAGVIVSQRKSNA